MVPRKDGREDKKKEYVKKYFVFCLQEQLK